MEWLTSIRTAIDYMEEHLTDDISAQDVAHQVYLSPFFLHKGFSLMTGYGIGEYIRNRRLYRAALDLKETDDIVIDIALRYGYETPESFKTDDDPPVIISGTVEKDNSTYTHPSIDGKTLTPGAALSVTVDGPFENGSVTADKSVALFGESVTVTVTPSASYRLKNLTYTPYGGDAVNITADADGVYSFSMPAVNVVISAEFEIAEYPFWVDGQRITADRMSGTGWSFEGNLESGRLTLTNANLTESYSNGGSCIYAKAPLTIVLEGENTVTGRDTGIYIDYAYDSTGTRIESDCDLNITGSGSLTVSGSQDGILPRAATSTSPASPLPPADSMQSTCRTTIAILCTDRLRRYGGLHGQRHADHLHRASEFDHRRRQRKAPECI